MELMQEAAAGVVGGLAAGTAMTVVVTAGKATGKIPEPLPVQVERRATEHGG